MLEHGRRVLTAIVRWPAAWLVRRRVPPNVVTAAGTVLFCAATLSTIPWGWLVVGPPLMGLTVLTDGLDGHMARATHPTKFGAFLDSTLDRVADGVMAGCVVFWLAQRPDAQGLVWSGAPAGWVAATRGLWLAVGLVALVTGQVIPYARARAESLGLDGRGGLTGRADRVLITCLALFLAGLGAPYALEAGVALMAVLGVVTVAQRMVKAARSGAPASEGSA